MPPLHRVYYFDHMSGLARYGPFIQLLKEVPLSSQNDHNGASRREVVTFHERCRELLSLIDSGGLGLSVDQLPRTGVRDLLILWSCVIPSISMSLESPVTFSLVRMTLVLVRKLGMNREEEAGTWGLEDGEPWHEEEKETVNRIWWALYTLDRWVFAFSPSLALLTHHELNCYSP